ncbi:hypothetical protein C8J57DRAFT_1262242 [Mycena rebaudengoi]|nr:hypothetical protein C8J57DRAFT_1262242 [Mycena rebaudengoi]
MAPASALCGGWGVGWESGLAVGRRSTFGRGGKRKSKGYPPEDAETRPLCIVEYELKASIKKEGYSPDMIKAGIWSFRLGDTPASAVEAQKLGHFTQLKIHILRMLHLHSGGRWVNGFGEHGRSKKSCISGPTIVTANTHPLNPTGDSDTWNPRGRISQLPRSDPTPVATALNDPPVAQVESGDGVNPLDPGVLADEEETTQRSKRVRRPKRQRHQAILSEDEKECDDPDCEESGDLEIVTCSGPACGSKARPFS